MMVPPIRCHSFCYAKFNGTSACIIVGRLCGDRFSIVVATNDHYLFGVYGPWNAHFHIECLCRSWSPLPSCHEKWIVPYLWSKALQVVDHLLRPIIREFI